MNDNLLDIACTTLVGEQKALGDFGGKALLVVNTASKCGFYPTVQRAGGVVAAVQGSRAGDSGLPL